MSEIIKITMEIEVPVNLVKNTFKFDDATINSKAFAKALKEQIDMELDTERFWEESWNNEFVEDVQNYLTTEKE